MPGLDLGAVNGHDASGGALPVGDGLVLDQTGSVTHTTGATSGSGSTSASATSTLVGAAGGLQINLIWDASVLKASNASAIEAAVVVAAKVYTSDFSNPVVLNIAVGVGEVGGGSLPTGAVGASENNVYLESYAAVAGALGTADAALMASGQMSHTAISATTADSAGSFLVTSAEAKVLGLATGQFSVDGYIGLAAGSSLFYGGGKIAATQYDAVGVAAHEISEVMGRISLAGENLAPYAHAYSTADLFRYLSSGTLDTTPAAAYFSLNNGATNLDNFNGSMANGDFGDWSTSTSKTDAFDAVGAQGVMYVVSATDQLEMAALGYKIAAGKTLTAVTA